MKRREINPWTWQEPYDFSHAIEIVGAEAAATQRGRERWRAYLACGLQPIAHAAPTAASHG